MNLQDYKIGQVITYSVCASTYTGQIVKIKEETLIVINDNAGMELWNAGIAVGHEITINQIKKMTKYLSFTGTFDVPTNHEELNIQFPMTYYHRHLGLNSHDEEVIEEYEQGFRSGLIYNSLDSNLDGINLYVSVIDENIGHLVVQCLNGGWNEETFCFLDQDGHPIHAEDNFNANPIQQSI